MQNSWLLFVLLQSAASATNSEALDCSVANQTVQLNRSHVVRTWQPDGVCPWPEHGWSQGSGPRWLVMQLRRPMLLETVELQNLGDNWHTASANGSSVSVFGAGSLLLELQLQDPCRASWNDFSRWDRWRSFRETGYEKQAPIAYLLIYSSTKWRIKSMRITGRIPLQSLHFTKPKIRWFEGLPVVRQSDRIRFTVINCDRMKIFCWLYSGNTTRDVNKVHSNSSGGFSVHKFTFEINKRNFNAHLLCGSSKSGTPLLEQVLTTSVAPRNMNMTVSPVLVSGRASTIHFSSDSYPETKHRCFVNSSSGARNLTLVSQTKQTRRDPDNRVTVRLRTEFSFNVSWLILNEEIICYVFGFEKSSADTKRTISAVSDPCVTDVDLGSSPHWRVGEVRQIRVTSRNCSVWTVTHICWVKDSDSNTRHFDLTSKINESDFASAHNLCVSPWMSQRGWSVRCSVNQSGVAHDEARSRSVAQDSVFYSGGIHISKNSTHNGSHLRVMVSSSKGRPRVSNVSCSSTDISAQPLESKAMTPVGNSINQWHNFSAHYPAVTKSSVFNISCSAQQIHDGQVQFLLHNSSIVTASAVDSTFGSTTNPPPDFRALLRPVTAALGLAVILAIFLALILLVRHRNIVLNKRSCGDRKRHLTSNGQSPTADRSIDDISFMTASQTSQTYAALLATVVEVISLQDSRDSSCHDDDTYFTEAVGHYEPDGCTFASYPTNY